ncbi:MAG: cysteine peptidase family C39 domain-containing protein [Verrucomicrobiales bacterium]
MRNSTEYTRCGQALRRVLLSLSTTVCVFCCLGLSSCNTLRPKPEPVYADPPSVSAPEPRDTAFKYCPLETVRQTSNKTCGLAALVAVMNYWEHDVDVETLEEKYPAKSEDGYPLLQLRRIATKEELIAFALTMKDRPLEQVSEQLENGRPVIVPVVLPDGQYQSSSGRSSAPQVNVETPPADSHSATKNHYVVIFGQSTDQFLLMDPAHGIIKVSKSEFTNYWSAEKYAALLCSSF